MRVTKFGHCCLLLETNGKRVLIDPGRFSTEQNELLNIDIVLITHEHPDHCHTESIASVLDKNPEAIVVTNASVEKLLQTMGVIVHVLEGRDVATVVGVSLEAFDGEHVEIFEEFGMVQNTGYFVDNYFFFPGDAYTVPNKPVEVLALPVAGPWCKVSEAISYALAVKAKMAFPVHDATLNEVGKSVTYPHFERELKKVNCEFLVLASGVAKEF